VLSKEMGRHRHDQNKPTSRSVDVVPDGRPTGRHRRDDQPGDLARLGQRLRPLYATPASRIGLAAGLTCCLGLAVAVGTQGASDPAKSLSAAVAEQTAAQRAAASRAADAAARQPASRGSVRDAITATPPVTPTTPAAPKPEPSKTPAKKATPTKKTPTPKKTPAKKATATKTAKPKPKPKPTKVAPVAGLTQAQMNNAASIVKAGQAMNVPKVGLVIAVATSMQESNLYNLASGVLPESMNYPNEGVGYDHDSVGLFQQRTSTGWGTIKEHMTPSVSASKFYAALLQVPGWQGMSLAQAAQTVQVSAFPDAYAKHEYNANVIVDALT
jgi:outer membrane biosynthesis protein TonB